MDEYVKSKLREWKLDELIPSFEAEKIDQETLLLLDDSTLTSLIPVIGLRLKFKKYLKNVLDESIPDPGIVSRAVSEKPSAEQHGLESNISLEEMTSFNVRDILLATPDGEPIIKGIEEKHCMSIHERRAMVRILVSHLMKCFGENPSAGTKVTLASSVVQQFPCLKDCQGKGYEAWFSPGRNHRPATGFLEERLRNVRKRLHRRRPNQSISNNPEEANNLTLPESTVDMERAIQMTEWLKNNIWPPSQVEQYMKETAIHRAKWIRDNGTKAVMEIVKEYPPLLDTPDMISQDFSILNPDSASKLTENWVPVFKDKILQFATREKQAVHLLSNLETMSADHQSDIALLVLPIILPTSIYKIGRKMFRPTYIETRKAFIDTQPIGTNMAEYLRSKGTIEFPYVLMLGDNECFQAFVILNGEALEQKTLLAAVDVCFKAFYVFDINYPKQCSPVWQFLQTVVFGLLGDETPSIRILRAFISAAKE